MTPEDRLKVLRREALHRRVRLAREGKLRPKGPEPPLTDEQRAILDAMVASQFRRPPETDD